jgi:hypothetical protein
MSEFERGVRETLAEFRAWAGTIRINRDSRPEAQTPDRLVDALIDIAVLVERKLLKPHDGG